MSSNLLVTLNILFGSTILLLIGSLCPIIANLVSGISSLYKESPEALRPLARLNQSIGFFTTSAASPLISWL